MIERSFKEDTWIKVNFQWDSGDPSVGISAGWGEETGACVEFGSMWMFIGFDVNPDREPKQWFIEDIQINQRIEDDRFKFVANLNRSRTDPPLQLLDFPEVCKRVEQTWEEIEAIEALERAGEDIWAAEEEVYQIQESEDDDRLAKLEAAERNLEEAKTKRDRLRAEYNEKYKREFPHHG